MEFFIGPTISSKEYQERLNPEYLENIQWFYRNEKELHPYAGSWVAIAQQRVCCQGDNLADVVKKATDRGLSESELVVEYIRKPEELFICLN